MSTNQTTPTARQSAIRGWSWVLAALVGAGLLFEGLSGLWIYLGPFSIGSQLLVIVHSVLGLGLLVLFVRYLVHHLKTWWRQKITAEMVLGYAGLVAVLVALISGLANTWYSAVGPRLGYTWDLVHLISGLSALGLVVAHLVTAFLRRRLSAHQDSELSRAMRSFPIRVSSLLSGTLATLVVASVLWPKTEVRFPVPDGYTLPTFAQEYVEYRDNPFAPTNARTADLQMVVPEQLANSASCGSAGCHEQILAEWEPSAHRFAAMNPPFQEVQRRFADDREPAETRYCAGCHDPISLFAGAKDPSSQDLSAPGVDEGISCIACHAVSQVDQRGNADYELTPPDKYLWEHDSGWRKWISDYLIRAFPRQHLADYDRNLLRTPEFCGACHKQFIPEALNRFGLVSGQNQYDEWKNSHWHTEDPATDLSCRDCHMRMVWSSDDPGKGEAGDRRRAIDDGAHRHHGFIATNNFMPAVLALPHWEKQVELTNEWVRGETVLPEIGGIWPEGPVVALELATPAAARPGDEVEVRLMIVNRKAGHNFITGPLDFVRSWVHLKAIDGDGNLLAEWGSIDPETRRIQDTPGVEHEIGNPRDEGTLVLESLPVDEKGEVLKQHELWKKAGGKGQRVIFPSYSDSHRYRLQVPADTTGPITLHADLNYRRYRQEFLDLVLPDLERTTGVYQPTVTQASVTRTIEIETPGSPDQSSDKASS